MDKNIAALLREDSKTIRVVFKMSSYEEKKAQANSIMTAFNPNQLYTYVTHLDVTPGDTVLVLAHGTLKLAEVAEVDETVNIQPNSDTEIKWVLQKIDLSDAEANEQKNKLIEQTVSDAYRTNLRRSFAQQILSGVDESKRLQLENLLK